eukprot:6200726-Pleurochrysis_carterae.AAC.2
MSTYWLSCRARHDRYKGRNFVATFFAPTLPRTRHSPDDKAAIACTKQRPSQTRNRSASS